MAVLLITGFEPFGKENINPSWEAVKLLPDTIGEWSLKKLEIPVVFGEASKKVLEAAEKLQPDVIICVGQAGGRSALTPEKIGINLRKNDLPDNSDAVYDNDPCVPNGPDAYFSTLPVEEMAENIRKRDIPGTVSYTAGTYVCNDTLYTLLHSFAGTRTRVGFIHVPYQTQQVKGSTPALPLTVIAQGLEAAILAISAQNS